MNRRQRRLLAGLLAGLCVVFLLGCSEPVRIDFVRLTDLWMAASPVRAEHVPQATIAGVTRIGIPIQFGGIESIPVAVPEAAELWGWVGLEDESEVIQRGAVVLKVGECAHETGDANALQAIAEVIVEPNGWVPLRVDLNAWSDRELELCFAATLRGQAARGEGTTEPRIWLAGATVARRGVAHKPARQPNVVLVNGRFGSGVSSSGGRVEGDGRGEGGALDRLSRRGERFSNAMMNAVLPLHANASLSSGLALHEIAWPSAASDRTGGMQPWKMPLEVRSLPELFWALGYGTAAFVSPPQLVASSGLAQGFDVYDDREAQAPPRESAAARAVVYDRAIAWIEDQSGAFFLFIDSSDAPGEGGVDESSDADLGRLIAALHEKGVFETTLIAVIDRDRSDRLARRSRGPKLDEPLLTDWMLRREFIVKYPRVIASSRVGARYDHRVDSLDLRATVMREAGLRDEFSRTRLPKGPPTAPGLRGLHEGRRHHFAEHSLDGGAMRSQSSGDRWIQSVHTRDWMLVRNGRNGRWLFDLAVEPLEQRDVAALNPGVTKDLLQVLDAWASSQPRTAPVDDVGSHPPALAELLEGRE